MNDFNGNIVDLRKRLEEKFGQKFEIKPSITIEATTLDDLYFKAIDSCLKHGRIYKIDSGSFKDENRIQFKSASLIVKHPTTRPLAPIPREGIPVTTNADKIEQYFWNYLVNGNLKENEHYTYGAWLVGIKDKLIKLRHKGILRGTRLNQLEWCINHFIEEGYGTNHCSITLGCAEGLKRYDWKAKTDADKGSTECLRQITLMIDENKLDLSCFFRSWDLVAGFPENLGGLARLMEYTSEMINMKAMEKGKNYPEVQPGTLIAYSPGLHIYEHNLEIAKLWVGLDK